MVLSPRTSKYGYIVYFLERDDETLHRDAVVFGDSKKIVVKKLNTAFAKIYKSLEDEGWKLSNTHIYMNNYIRDAETLMKQGRWYN